MDIEEGNKGSRAGSAPKIQIKQKYKYKEKQIQLKYRKKYQLSGGVEGRMDIEEGNKGKLVLVVLQILPSWVTLAR